MSYAQQLLDEGEAKGRAEGRAEGRIQERIRIIQGCIEAEVSWDVIQAATGLTEAGFQELKAQAASSGS